MTQTDQASKFQPTTTRRRNGETGFTLIELLITMAIVAILAAVAVPLYNQRVAEARQTGAQRNLMALAQLQEIYRFQNGQYTAAINDLTNLGWQNDTEASGVGHYDFNITAASATAFTIEATGDIGTGTTDKWTITEQGKPAPG